MATFGSGVNAALGAINYSPYTQGAIAGGQGIGQGIAALGQAAGQAVSQYYDKKEQNELLGASTARISQILKDNPSFAQVIGIKDPSDEKAVKVAIKAIGGGDVRKGVAGAEQLVMGMQQQQQQQAMQQQQQEAQRRAYAAALQMQQVAGPSQAAQAMQQGATFEQLPQGPGAFQPTSVQQAPDALGVMQRLLAAGVDPSQVAGVGNAVTAAQKQPTPPAQPNLSQFEQLKQTRLDLFRETNRREPTTSEVKKIEDEVVGMAKQEADPDMAARLGLAAKELPIIGERADTAMRILPNLNSLQKKFEAGLQTGKLEQFKNDAVSLARGLGLPVDEAALGQRESASAQFGQFLIEYFAATKGAITERENALFASMGPQFSKSPEANKDLLNLVKTRLDLDTKLGKIYRDGLSKKSIFEINDELQKAREDFEKKFETNLYSLEQKYGSKPATSGGVDLGGGFILNP